MTGLVLTFLETCRRIYSVILRKPHLSVKVEYAPQRDSAGEVTRELVALTVVNESSPEVDVDRVWFLTTYKRMVVSELLDSKLPLKLLGNNRATYFLPIEEFKGALNRSIGETIAQAVAFDRNERRYVSRVGRVAQQEFAR